MKNATKLSAKENQREANRVTEFKKRNRYTLPVICCLVAILFTGIGGGIHAMITPRYIVREFIVKEIKTPETRMNFYIALLRTKNYTVTEENLAVTEWENAESIESFLWILTVTNSTQCFVDYGQRGQGLMIKQWIRAPKLWVQFDGIYFELRVLK